MFAALRNERRIVPLQSPFNTEHEVRFSVSPYIVFKCNKHIISSVKLKFSMLNVTSFHSKATRDLFLLSCLGKWENPVECGVFGEPDTL